MEKITMKYDQGIKQSEIVTLEIPTHELEQLIENDYQYRLAYANNPVEINRRSAQAIITEWNRHEYNSWQTHNRRKIKFQRTDNEAAEIDWQDLIADNTQLENLTQQEDYEAICQKIHSLLKPQQAEMMITICIDGMSVKDYAQKIGDKPKRVSERYNYAKGILKKAL